MATLIDELKARQGERSQLDFAENELGISQSHLSRIYSGDKKIGLESLRKIVRRYPELRNEVIAFLLGDDMPTDHSDCLLMPA